MRYVSRILIAISFGMVASCSFPTPPSISQGKSHRNERGDEAKSADLSIDEDKSGEKNQKREQVSRPAEPAANDGLLVLNDDGARVKSLSNAQIKQLCSMQNPKSEHVVIDIANEDGSQERVTLNCD